jgi:hypothetical protein
MGMTVKARLGTWRARLPVVAVVVACVAAVVAAVTGAANPVSAVQFLMPGHWVYNSALGAVFHIDGSTGNVDARADVPGSAGDRVYQGDTSGYVVGSSRVTEFGKSSLEVAETRTPESRSIPAGVETRGGPYLVYQQEGKVVRLGDPRLVVSLGGPVGAPVATGDGTLWLPRTSAGLLCRLTAGSTTPSCSIALPKGHDGALTVVGDRVMFVDTTADTVHSVEGDGLGAGRDLGVDVSGDARLASTDVAGRVAILDGQSMHLVDTSDDRPADPVEVTLPDGDYDGPVSTGEVVAVVDKESGTLTTYGSDGTPKKTKTLPAGTGDPHIARGEDDRVYVYGDEGEHVVVVDEDGALTDVPITDGPGDGGPPRGGPGQGEPPVEGNEPPTRTPDPGPRQPPPTEEQEEPPPPDERDQEPPPPPVVPATPPGAPTGVTATAGDSTATVSWGPAPDNRAPITGYTITWAGGRTTAAPGARTANIGGLANGTSYVFTVAAANAKGTGPGASSNPVTPVPPFRAASAPRNLTADNDTGAATVTANWTAPADMGTGTFVHYAVQVVGVQQVTVTDTSMTLNAEIDQELTITVTPVTADPSGRQVPGAPATVITGQPPGGTAKVNLSRGPATTAYCGELPGCAWMHVELVGFPPNADIFVDPQSTDPEYQNEGYTFRTDANGYAVDDQFAYAGVGHTVHVNADLDGEQIRSNDVEWSAG